MSRLFLALLILTLPSRAEVSFKSQVAPILLQKCVTCHGPDKAKSAYRLDTYSALMKAGDSEKPTIISGSPGESHLFQLITTTDEDDRMPQKAERLSDAEILAIREWIAAGAKFDGTSKDQSLAMLVPYQPGPEAPAHYPFPQPVLALAWSDDGKTLASSGYHEALLWDAGGKLTRRVNRLPERIHGLAFTADNQLAIAAGAPGKSGEVLIVNLNSTEPPMLLARMPDVAVSLAVNHDRTRLAAGGADNAIHVFELPGGKELFSIQQHADWVTALCFSPDGTKLASASRDRTARLFDASNGNLLESYVEHTQPLFAVAFAADGKKIFSGGRGKKVHAWQAEEAKKAGEFPNLEGDILALCVDQIRLFAAGGEKNIREFNADSRKQSRVLSGHADWVYSLALHAPTDRLASGSYDGEIRIWDAGKGELISAFKAAP